MAEKYNRNDQRQGSRRVAESPSERVWAQQRRLPVGSSVQADMAQSDLGEGARFRIRRRGHGTARNQRERVRLNSVGSRMPCRALPAGFAPRQGRGKCVMRTPLASFRSCPLAATGTDTHYLSPTSANRFPLSLLLTSHSFSLSLSPSHPHHEVHCRRRYRARHRRVCRARR